MDDTEYETSSDSSSGGLFSSILDGIQSVAQDVVPLIKSSQPAPIPAPGAPPAPAVGPGSAAAVASKSSGAGIPVGLIVAAAALYFILK